MSLTTEMVQRRGRVFKFGDHVDGKGKTFSLSRDEWEAAHPEGFEVPVGFDPIGRGHYSKPHAFEGKLGSASGFAVEDPYLDADFALHPLLDDAIRAEGLRMSAVFGIADKRLRRIDVTDRPVLEEAAFFAEDDSDEVVIFADFPGLGLPPAHALGEEPEEDEGPLSGEELAQHLHEILVAEYPGLCEAEPAEMTPEAGFCKDGMSDKVRGHMTQMHDFCVHHGASCSGMGHASFAEEDTEMADDTEDQDQFDPEALFARMEAIEKAAVAKETAAEARIKALEAMNKKLRDDRLSADAVAFARDHADRIAPPAQPFFVGLYRSLAADDDGDDAVIGFAYGKENAQEFKGSRVDLLKKAVEALPAHGIGGQKTLEKRLAPPPPTNGVVVFSNDDPDSDPSVISDDRKKELDRLNAANK